MIKNLLLVCASAGALLGQGTALAQNTKSDYLAIVGNSGATTGFQSTKTPSILKLVNFGTPYAVKMIDYEAVDSSPGKMKFFLPPGTVAFNANLYFFLAYQEGKGVLRLNQPPEENFSNIGPANVFTTENLGGSTGRAYDETVLNNLVAGKEVRYFSEGGSANFMVLSSPENLIEPMTTGGYIYGNFQYPGGRLQRSLWKIYVKADCYDQWFNSRSTQWNTFGNPDENATHTCAGSTGGGTVTPPPTLTGITLSPDNWNAATDEAKPTIKVTPKPEGATLPTCTASSPNLLTLKEASSATEALFDVIIPTAVTENTKVTIDCGGKTAFLTLKPANIDAAQVKNNVPSADANGKLVLNFNLVRTASEIADKTKTSFWVAAQVPKNGFFFTEDEWFFLKPKTTAATAATAVAAAKAAAVTAAATPATPTAAKAAAEKKAKETAIAAVDAYGWTQLVLPNSELVAYQSKDDNVAPKLETSLTVPIGLSQDDLGYFNISIHFGYMDAEGGFKNMGVIWKKD